MCTKYKIVIVVFTIKTIYAPYVSQKYQLCMKGLSSKIHMAKGRFQNSDADASRATSFE